MKKLLSIILAVFLVTSVAVFSGCSNGNGGAEETTAAEETTQAAEEETTEAAEETTEAAEAKDVPKVAGKVESWGQVAAVLVPEGMSFSKGAYGDEADETAVTISDESAPLNHYYLIDVMTSDEIEDSLTASKEINEEYGIEDVASFTEGKNEFSGITYGEKDSFKVYILSMKSGDKTGMVTLSVKEGDDLSSDEVRAVLASIEIK